jgi:hypothetical protein
LKICIDQQRPLHEVFLFDRSEKNTKSDYEKVLEHCVDILLVRWHNHEMFSPFLWTKVIKILPIYLFVCFALRSRLFFSANRFVQVPNRDSLPADAKNSIFILHSDSRTFHLVFIFSLGMRGNFNKANAN